MLLRFHPTTFVHTIAPQEKNMAEQLPQEQTVTIEELVISHSYEMIALITVLERKGILSRDEVIEVIKELKDSTGKG